MNPSPEDYLEETLTQSAPSAALLIADALAVRYPAAAIFLYGSGISVSAHEDPTGIMFDFYVITNDYREAIENRLERIAARLIPPNVYYFEVETPMGRLRSKYALLSVGAFEALAGPNTFHSYFWARFAQPSRLVLCPDLLRPRMIRAVRIALATFLQRSQGIAADPLDWRSVWLAGMSASYRAELRAESAGRAERLIDSYGEWPARVAAFSLNADAVRTLRASLAWRVRSIVGALLSVIRLLKATTTFKGGIDYIAWKVKRHAGVDVGVRPWERKHPFFAAPVVAFRYFRLRAASRRAIAEP